MNKILLKIQEYTYDFIIGIEIFVGLLYLGVIRLIEIWNDLKESIGL